MKTYYYRFKERERATTIAIVGRMITLERGIKQRRYRAITLQGTIEKSELLDSPITIFSFLVAPILFSPTV